ncbi:MAG: adenylosuccinate lyase [Spirochaetota bacterium]|nr:adenylosuccinate lyase [Spirochaetota bacterium]
MNHKQYQNPLIQRYASDAMSYIFSPEFRFRTWRKLWIALAKSQKNLGLNIEQEQIDELIAFKDNINYDIAWEHEKRTKHEVMSHIHAYGDQCPKAKGIIHLGATSAYVLDNTDIIQMKEALFIIKKQLVNLISTLKGLSILYKNQATLGFTHYQPAQPTTVGKRIALWLQDLLYDYHELIFRIKNLGFRGVKGTTGTQNSFLKLFEGDHKKVKELDMRVTKEMGFEKPIMVTGQTYSRKLDYFIMSILSSIAQSCYKFSNDIRLLQNLGEVDEPFEEDQVGSSAMPYKRNPMRSERIASLARYVINLTQNAAFTSANQWLERTLDDSANKRLSIPEAFMGVDTILTLYQNISRGLKVHKKVIEKHLEDELPFMVTEDIIMESVKRGGDRQEIHEIIRKNSIEAVKRIKELGERNPLLDLLGQNEKIPFTTAELNKFCKAEQLVGLSKTQVEDFINEEVEPILRIEKDLIENKSLEIKV